MKKHAFFFPPTIFLLFTFTWMGFSGYAQNVGIGTTAPLSLVHISNGNLLVTGNPGVGNAIEITGPGARFFFNPRKATIRAGFVNGSQWDDVNTGNFSVGLGVDAIASTQGSISIGEANIAETSLFAVAIGRQNHSTGFASLAMGHFSEATGDYSSSIGLRDTVSGFGASSLGSYNKVGGAYSFAAGFENIVNSVGSSVLGVQNNASGFGSFAAGRLNYTQGNHSTALGFSDSAAADQAFASGWGNMVSGNNAAAIGTFNFAPSYGEITLGNYATRYTPASSTSLQPADRVLTVGIGENDNERKDAMVILKNGHVGVGTNNPDAKLHIQGAVKIADGSQGAGKVLTSDADGLASWQPVSLTKAYFSAWLYGATEFVLTNGVERSADFSETRYNNNINYTGGTITVPEAGLYHFDILGQVANTFINTQGIQIRTYVNGGLNEQAFAGNLSKDLLLNANDQVEFKFFQNSGGNVTLNAFSRISCHKIY